MSRPFVGLNSLGFKPKQSIKLHKCTFKGCEYLFKSKKKLYCPEHSATMLVVNKNNYDRKK